MAPESMAEALAGATGWARGNQKCSGINPALEPKPSNAKTKTVSRSPGESRAAFAEIAANDVSPAASARSVSATSTQSAPVCATTRYVKVARRTPRRSWCAATKNAETSDIASHAKKKSATLRATRTKSIDAVKKAINNGSRDPPRRVLHRATAIARIARSAQNGALNDVTANVRASAGTFPWIVSAGISAPCARKPITATAAARRATTNVATRPTRRSTTRP